MKFNLSKSNGMKMWHSEMWTGWLSSCRKQITGTYVWKEPGVDLVSRLSLEYHIRRIVKEAKLFTGKCPNCLQVHRFKNIFCIYQTQIKVCNATFGHHTREGIQYGDLLEKYHQLTVPRVSHKKLTLEGKREMGKHDEILNRFNDTDIDKFFEINKAERWECSIGKEIVRW